MMSFAELIAFCALIVSIIKLVVYIQRKKK